MTLALTFTSVCDPACICPNLCQDEIKHPRTATQNTPTPRHTFKVQIPSIRKKIHKKCVLTDVAGVVKTAEHFIDSKGAQVIPERTYRGLNSSLTYYRSSAKSLDYITLQKMSIYYV